MASVSPSAVHGRQEDVVSAPRLAPSPVRRGPLLRTALALGLLALVAGGTWTPAAGEPPPESSTWSESYFPSGDGIVLHADVFLPKSHRAGDRHPVVLMVTPYAGTGGVLIPDPTKSGPALDTFALSGLFDRLMERDYAFVQVDLRGYGASQGCLDLGGKGEQADVKAAVEWAASQPWSTGRVGMYGGSYTGFTGIMALANKPKGLSAAVIWAPIMSFYNGVYMNRVHYGLQQYATAGGYVAIDLTLPSVNADLAQHQGAAGRQECRASTATMLAQSHNPDPNSPFWKERELVSRAAGSTVPTIWADGWEDNAARPENTLPIFSRLAGPHRAWFGSWHHRSPGDPEESGRDGFDNEVLRWYDRYLKQLPPGQAPVEKDPPVVVQQFDGTNARWRAEEQWPPTDARFHPLEGNPGTYQDAPGNRASRTPDPEYPWTDAEKTLLSVPISHTGNGLWTITQPLPYAVDLAGVTKVTATVSTQVPSANLFGILYDIFPDGTAALVSRGAYQLAGSGEVSFDLYPRDWRFRPGHRIGMLIAGSEEEFWRPPHTLSTVTVEKSAFSLQTLCWERTELLDGGLGTDMTGDARPIPTQVSAETIEANERQVALPPQMRSGPAQCARASRDRRLSSLDSTELASAAPNELAATGAHDAGPLAAALLVATAALQRHTKSRVR